MQLFFRRRNLAGGTLPLMGRNTALMIVCSKTNKPAAEAEWSAWYDEEHLPDLFAALGPDAPQVATRFALSRKPEPGMPGLGYSHVTIYELGGADPAAQLGRIFAADRELRARGRIHPTHAVIDVQQFVPHGPYADKPEPSAGLRGHIPRGSCRTTRPEKPSGPSGTTVSTCPT